MSDAGLPPPPPPLTPPPGAADDSAGAPSNSVAPPPPPPSLTAPAGYVAFNNAPTPVGTLKRVGLLAKLAMVATAVSGIVGVISTFLVIPAIDKAPQFIDGTISEDEFNDAYLPSQLVSTLGTVAGLAAGVFTILWMYRIAANLRVYSRATTFAPVFAIVGWLLPPFLFVLPLLVLRELWKASDPNCGVGDQGWRSETVNPLLYVWFAIYGVIPAGLQGVIAYSTFSALFDDGFITADSTLVTAEALDSSGQFTILAGAVTAIAAVVWIVLLKQLTARHVELTGET